jgi:hypothetical protein
MVESDSEISSPAATSQDQNNPAALGSVNSGESVGQSPDKATDSMDSDDRDDNSSGASPNANRNGATSPSNRANGARGSPDRQISQRKSSGDVSDDSFHPSEVQGRNSPSPSPSRQHSSARRRDHDQYNTNSPGYQSRSPNAHGRPRTGGNPAHRRRDERRPTSAASMPTPHGSENQANARSNHSQRGGPGESPGGEHGGQYHYASSARSKIMSPSSRGGSSTHSPGRRSSTGLSQQIANLQMAYDEALYATAVQSKQLKANIGVEQSLRVEVQRYREKLADKNEENKHLKRIIRELKEEIEERRRLLGSQDRAAEETARKWEFIVHEQEMKFVRESRKWKQNKKALEMRVEHLQASVDRMADRIKSGI